MSEPKRPAPTPKPRSPLQRLVSAFSWCYHFRIHLPAHPPRELCPSKVTMVAYSRACAAMQDYRACLSADYKAQHKKLTAEKLELELELKKNLKDFDEYAKLAEENTND